MSTERNKRTYKVFQRIVLNHFRKQGRHMLPWRQTTDPYCITVSELMLQQTQVSRVVEKYQSFLKRFPTVHALARAPLVSVLKKWQGLGYNRRATFLHALAKTISTQYSGMFPQTVSQLESLPGIGPYTARAIAVFAYNQPVVLIETNIRTVFIHHFFQDKTSVSDAQLLPHIEAALYKRNPRMWYAALMDYGSYLKQSGNRSHRRSTTYVRQKPFQGSTRQLRGAIIASLIQAPQSLSKLTVLLKQKKEVLEPVLETLVHEQLIRKVGRLYRIR